VAASAAAVGATRNRATSSFAAMSSAGDAGGEPSAPAPIRSSARPAAANIGGNGGSTGGGTKPLKLPDLSGERGADA